MLKNSYYYFIYQDKIKLIKKVFVVVSQTGIFTFSSGFTYLEAVRYCHKIKIVFVGKKNPTSKRAYLIVSSWRSIEHFSSTNNWHLNIALEGRIPS